MTDAELIAEGRALLLARDDAEKLVIKGERYVLAISAWRNWLHANAPRLLDLAARADEAREVAAMNHENAREGKTILDFYAVWLRQARDERNAAIDALRVIGEELVLAGYPGGDRKVMLANVRAAIARTRATDLLLSRVLHELAGAASLCWKPKPVGVFDTEQATAFVEGAIKELRAALRGDAIDAARGT